MAKLTRESKIENYNRRKSGESVSSLAKAYDIGTDKIKYLESENSQLKESNLYLEAEGEYLKKLHAVI